AALEVPVRAVVGDDQAVLLHRAQDGLRVGAEGRDVVAGLEAEARTHRRKVWIIRRAGLMTRRPDVRAVRLLRRHADRVVDVAGLHLVETNEAGEDRKAGGVGGRPAVGPESVRGKAP